MSSVERRLTLSHSEQIERIEHLKRYVASAQADNTRRGYAADWQLFEDFCYANDFECLPATPQTVALFLVSQAQDLETDPDKIARKRDKWLLSGKGRKPEDYTPFKYKVSSIERRRSAINDVHNKTGHLPPSQHDERYLITAAMTGIKRERSKHEEVYKTSAATDEVVLKLLDHIEGDCMKDIRDAAIISFGFATAMRRSELCALNFEDLTFSDKGVEVFIRASKTDKSFKGQSIAVPNGRIIRPVAHLEKWLEAANITSGPIFRRLFKGGSISESALDDSYISKVIKKRALAANLDPNLFSGHSLRAGFITTAAVNDVSLSAIMEQSRHRSVESVRGYTRMTEQFKHNAGNSFL